MPGPLNQGVAHRLTISIEPRIVTADADADVIFDGGEVDVDWSNYSFAQAYSYRVKPTDTFAIALGTSTLEVIYIKTSGPIEVDYTQDGVARVAFVKPLVFPANWLTTTHSPSEIPQQYQKGIFLLMGGVISALTIKGINTSTPVSNVIVAVAGYNT